MIIAFGIWSIVALIFLGIGVNVNEKVYHPLTKKFTTPLAKKFTSCY